MNLVIIGAGKAGRGFLARLLYTQAQLTLIDDDRSLIEALQDAGSYSVRFFDDAPTDHISGYQALHISNPACKDALFAADAVFICVGAQNTLGAASWLKEVLPKQLPVIVCENAVDPASLAGPFKDTAISGAVFCTTIEDGVLDIASENYPELHVSKKGLPPEIDALQGISSTDDFASLMLRKIYTYNGASAIIAYNGAYKGYAVYAEAASDPDIEALTNAFYLEINFALSSEYGIPLEVQTVFAKAADAKFHSFEIEDTIVRNAAVPERKLGPEERIIAPAKLIDKHGGDPSAMFTTAAAALLYMGIKTNAEAKEALLRISKLEENDLFLEPILSAYDKLSKNKKE